MQTFRYNSFQGIQNLKANIYVYHLKLTFLRQQQIFTEKFPNHRLKKNKQFRTKNAFFKKFSISINILNK